MAGERLDPSVRYMELVAQLSKGITIHPRIQEFTAFQPPPDWEPVGIDRDDIMNMYKMKALNRKEGVFVKAFSPTTEDYGLKVFSTLRQLATLGLRFPILSPVSFLDRMLIYPLGEDEGTIRWGMLPQEDTERVREVVEQHGLTPLEHYSSAPLVGINGRTYVTDPIEDSANSIYEYLDVKRKGIK